MSQVRIAIPTPTSFDHEYNRKCFPQYVAAVELSGAVAVEVSPGLSPAEIASLVTGCHGILLPGSPADVNPQKYGQTKELGTANADLARENVDELLLQDAHNLYKPVFGICFGLQTLNVWRGGTLVQDLCPIPVNHGAGPSIAAAHAILITRSSLLGDAACDERVKVVEAQTDEVSVFVNSSHHQAVGISGDNLRITARSQEDGVIEGLEGGQSGSSVDQHFVLGVQWHPERSFAQDAFSRKLFSRFVDASTIWHPRTVMVSVG